MLPISSDYPVRGFSPVTWIIIALCAGIAFAQLLQMPSFSDETFFVYGVHPVLVVFDIFPWNPDSLAVASSLVTSLFVHAGILHVVGNMLFFHCFSMPVESLMGPWRYAAFYLLCGIAAALTHSLVSPDSYTPLVGASGAVAGVLAAHAILLPWTQIRVPSSLLGPNSYPAWVFTGLWLAYQVIYILDEDQNVAWLAHVGGIAAGLMLAPLFSKPGVLVMAPTPGTDEAREHGPGYKVATLPALALALALPIGLGGWMVNVQTNGDAGVKARAGEWIAIARISGVDVPRDTERGLARYREAAAADPDIAVRLAKRLQAGNGVPRNDAQALEWYRRAAEQQQPEAVVVYALALIEGKSVARDDARATAMLIELSKQNYSSADLQIGLIFETGLGGATIDLEAAAKYYRRACETQEWRRAKITGKSMACYRLALMLFNGRGVPKDAARAQKLLKREASDGLPAAENAYALFLLTGDPESGNIGAERGPNDTEARRLLEAAARAGNIDAAANLARLNARR